MPVSNLKKSSGPCLVVVLLAMVGLSGCESSTSSKTSTPSNHVKSVWEAGNAGNYSEATAGFSSQMSAALENTAQFWNNVTRKGTITKVEIEQEEVRGDGATVWYSLYFKDGQKKSRADTLIKEGGRWKISKSSTAWPG